jgi:hypothetical protein
MRRGLVAALAAGCLLAGSCATEGTGGGGVGVYDGFYYDDPWGYYGAGGIWVGAGGGDIGPPPHPAHPIVKPDPPRVENPIVKPDPPKATPRASTSMSRPMPSARPAMRGGGGRR